jgi:hypothetical protein
MPGRAEQYFLSQITTLVGIPSGILATGYFRSVVQDRPAEQDSSLFVDTAIARGYFIALARDRLIVVKTQAPTSSKPMLDNQGVVVIPLAKVRRLAFESNLFLIDSEIETLSLELKWTNKHFPSQERLIGELAAGFNESQAVASIRASQRRKRWLKVAVVVVAIVAAIVVAVYQHRP